MNRMVIARMCRLSTTVKLISYCYEEFFMLPVGRILNREGIREDGRFIDQSRAITLRSVSVADASAFAVLISMGLTKVLVEARGPVANFKRNQGLVGAPDSHVFVDVAFALDSASKVRKQRPRGDRIGMDLTKRVRDVFASVIDGSTFDRSRVELSITVLVDDGGVDVAAMTGAMAVVPLLGVHMKGFVGFGAIQLVGATTWLSDPKASEVQECAGSASIVVGVQSFGDREGVCYLRSEGRLTPALLKAGLAHAESIARDNMATVEAYIKSRV